VGHGSVASVSGRRVPRHDRVGGATRVRLSAYGYATLWFVTPYFAASVVLFFVVIVVYRRAERPQRRRGVPIAVRRQSGDPSRVPSDSKCVYRRPLLGEPRPLAPLDR